MKRISSPSVGFLDSRYAKVALDNLASVAINASLLPATSGAINIGSLAKQFGEAWFDMRVVTPIWQFADSTGVKLSMSTAFGRDDIDIEATSGTDTDMNINLKQKGDGDVNLLHRATIGNLGKSAAPWTNLFIV